MFLIILLFLLLKQIVSQYTYKLLLKIFIKSKLNKLIINTLNYFILFKTFSKTGAYTDISEYYIIHLSFKASVADILLFG